MEGAAFEEIGGPPVTRIIRDDYHGLTLFISEPGVRTNFPGLKIPFGLQIGAFPLVHNFLLKNPEAVEAANIMLSMPLSLGSQKSYSPVIKEFQDFCQRKNYCLTNFSEENVVEFLGHVYANKASISYFAKIIPSLRAYEKMVKLGDSALTPRVEAMVNSFKRELCKKRAKVKKGTGYPIDFFSEIVVNEIFPYEFELYKVNVNDFRSVFRAIVIYFTFCRFSDFNVLRDRDFEDNGHFIEINFTNSKNDQYFEGTNSVIPVSGENFCPVKLIRLFFKRFGLKFAHEEGTETSSVNFRLAKRGQGRSFALKSTKLSCSTATKYTRILLQKHGIDGSRFTEKSMKISGVTALCDTGEPLENVAIAGRWKSSTTPMHYRNTSKKFRVEVAKRIPLSNKD